MRGKQKKKKTSVKQSLTSSQKGSHFSHIPLRQIGFLIYMNSVLFTFYFDISMFSQCKITPEICKVFFNRTYFSYKYRDR